MKNKWYWWLALLGIFGLAFSLGIIFTGLSLIITNPKDYWTGSLMDGGYWTGDIGISGYWIIPVIVFLFMYMIGIKNSKPESISRLFRFTIVWGYLQSIGYLILVSNQFNFFEYPYEIITVLVSLFLASSLFFFLDKEDFKDLITIERKEKTYKLKRESEDKNKNEFWIKYFLAPIVVGLVIGFISYLLTGQFSSGGGVAVIGSLVTVVNNSIG